MHCYSHLEVILKLIPGASENNLPVDLRSSIYCAAIAKGDDQDWNFLMLRFREEVDDLNERKNILAGLSCSKEIWALQVLRDASLLFTNIWIMGVAKHDG